MEIVGLELMIPMMYHTRLKVTSKCLKSFRFSLRDKERWKDLDNFVLFWKNPNLNNAEFFFSGANSIFCGPCLIYGISKKLEGNTCESACYSIGCVLPSLLTLCCVPTHLLWNKFSYSEASRALLYEFSLEFYLLLSSSVSILCLCV